MDWRCDELDRSEIAFLGRAVAETGRPWEELREAWRRMEQARKLREWMPEVPDGTPSK